MKIRRGKIKLDPIEKKLTPMIQCLEVGSLFFTLPEVEVTIPLERGGPSGWDKQGKDFYGIYMVCTKDPPSQISLLDGPFKFPSFESYHYGPFNDLRDYCFNLNDPMKILERRKRILKRLF